jgi:hypothetical protein
MHCQMGALDALFIVIYLNIYKPFSITQVVHGFKLQHMW